MPISKDLKSDHMYPYLKNEVMNESSMIQNKYKRKRP